MDRLPSLVLRQLFDYFNVNEKLRLKRVCKSWKIKIESILDHDQMSLFVHLGHYPNNLKWSYQNDLVGYANSLKISNAKNPALTLAMFQRVRSLFLFKYYPGVEFELFKQLNCFENLEQLEIYKCEILSKSARLELRKLRILSIKKTKIGHQVELETPVLGVLIFWSQVRLIKFNYPERLRHLETLDFKLCTSQFTNLETLVCQNLCTDGDEFCSLDALHLKIIGSLASETSKLKAIQLVDLGCEDPINDELKRQRATLEKGGLKLTILTGFDNSRYCCWRGYKYPFEGQDPDDTKNEFQHLPDRISWFIDCEYSLVLRAFDPLPDGFLSKLPNIKYLKIKKAEDSAKLISFLNGCCYLRSLKIHDAGLDRQFYGRLCLINSLRRLKIRERNWPVDEFDWIGRLDNLKEIEFESDRLAVAFILAAFERCPHLERFRFKTFTFRVGSDMNRFELLRGGDGQHVLCLQTVVFFNTLPHLTSLLKKSSDAGHFIN